MVNLASVEQQSLLAIKGLTTTINTPDGMMRVIDDVNFTIEKGEIVAVVGESGSGKSMTINSIMQLLPKDMLAGYEGAIELDGKNLFSHSRRTMQNIRGKRISLIAQNAMTSLDPSYTVGKQIVEIILNKTSKTKSQAVELTCQLLKAMGIEQPERVFHSYPHQLSGGLRQRVVIAMSLACEPEILIADEPTSALDPTVQLQVLDLLLQINKTLGTAILMVTHDFGVVAHIAQKVVVMYAGQVVEKGYTRDIIERPQHPYTKSLLKCIPNLEWIFKDGEEKRPLWQIDGEPPNLLDFQSGCRFANRCPYAQNDCFSTGQKLISLSEEGHEARCMYAIGGGQA